MYLTLSSGVNVRYAADDMPTRAHPSINAGGGGGGGGGGGNNVATVSMMGIVVAGVLLLSVHLGDDQELRRGVPARWPFWGTRCGAGPAGRARSGDASQKEKKTT